VRAWDNNAIHWEHILSYARIYNQLAGPGDLILTAHHSHF
jgi:hypothetical protein